MSSLVNKVKDAISGDKTGTNYSSNTGNTGHGGVDSKLSGNHDTQSYLRSGEHQGHQSSGLPGSFPGSGQGHDYDSSTGGQGYGSSNTGHGLDSSTTGQSHGLTSGTHSAGQGYDSSNTGRGYDNSSTGQGYDSSNTNRGYDNSATGQSLGLGSSTHGAGQGYDNNSAGRGYDNSTTGQSLGLGSGKHSDGRDYTSPTGTAVGSSGLNDKHHTTSHTIGGKDHTQSGLGQGLGGGDQTYNSSTQPRTGGQSAYDRAEQAVTGRDRVGRDNEYGQPGHNYSSTHGGIRDNDLTDSSSRSHGSNITGTTGVTEGLGHDRDHHHQNKLHRKDVPSGYDSNLSEGHGHHHNKHHHDQSGYNNDSSLGRTGEAIADLHGQQGTSSTVPETPVHNTVTGAGSGEGLRDGSITGSSHHGTGLGGSHNTSLPDRSTGIGSGNQFGQGLSGQDSSSTTHHPKFVHSCTKCGHDNDISHHFKKGTTFRIV